MPVEGIGENFSYATSILVNGVEQQSFVQESDSSYDVQMEPSTTSFHHRFTHEMGIVGPNTFEERWHTVVENFTPNSSAEIRIYASLNRIVHPRGDYILTDGDRDISLVWPDGSTNVSVGHSFDTGWFAMSDGDIVEVKVNQGNSPDFGIYEVDFTVETRETISSSVDITGVTQS